MSKILAVIAAAVIIILSISDANGENLPPLTATEVMALVAGNALSETVVREIRVRGLAFAPDSSYREKLKAAGADDSITEALGSARTAAGAPAVEKPQLDILQKYVDAFADMYGKKYEAASADLSDALQMSFDKADTGFVMGALLTKQERYMEAKAVFEEVLHENPDYPEAHSKLSFVLYKLQQTEDAYREALAALMEDLNDPEGHKNAALALEDMRRFDAGEAEYKKALALKPGYAIALYDLGNLYREKGDLKDAIDQYRKSVALNPDDYGEHNNLGVTLQRNGDLDSAIREFREAKRLDPAEFSARSNLANALLQKGMYAEAVPEFRELVKMFPLSEVCHECLGHALYMTSHFAEAESEFQTALKADPADAFPHVGLARIRLEQKNFDEALKEFLLAEKLDPNDWQSWTGAGQVYLGRNDFVQAVSELKKAEILQPSNARIHEFLAQALLGAGNDKESIDEFKESLTLNSKQYLVALELAAAYEKDGQWPEALDEYRNTAQQVASLDRRGLKISDEVMNAEKDYQQALIRFNDHVAALKATGKTSEAADLETRLRAKEANPDLSQKLNASIQAGLESARKQDYDQALENFKKAVEIGQQMQPPDERLITALDHLGNGYMGRDFPSADATFEEELKVTQQIYGPQSPNMDRPLQSLGTSALLQHNYPEAEKFYFRAVDADDRAYGESSDRVAASLVMATRVFVMQQQYDKAEPHLLRAERIDESIYGVDDPNVMLPLWTLCNVYDKWGKADKAVECYTHALRIGEKEFGPSNPQLVTILAAQGAALKGAGRTTDADQAEKRAASLRAATMASNP